MCGIIGLITTGEIPPGKINALHQKQIHRGPDARSEFIARDNSGFFVTFLHQRLSIIDLETGNQPMSAFDETLWIVYNGEIFNYLELKSELQKKAYQFRTKNSDTEVLLCLYKEYGTKMLNYLNGMFAFAIYDSTNSSIFIARDRIGIKPVYYFKEHENFYFASELKTLLELKSNIELNEQSLVNYLSFQYIPSPMSIVEGINKLEAANFLIYNIATQTITKNQYWDLSFNISPEPFESIKEKLRAKIEESVKYWTISDVEVAASLSGGIDSSTLVALYAKNSEKKIKTFSLGFDADAHNLDELKLAGKVADKYQTEHVEYVLKAGTLLTDLRKMVFHLDEPYAGGLPSWYIYKLMAKHVKVALTGTGGDELFGNYTKARVYSSLLYKWLRFLNRNRLHFTRELKTWYNYPLANFYPRCFSGQEILNNVLNPDRLQLSHSAPEKLSETIFRASPSKIPGNFIPYHDFKMQLPEEFLHMTDRFSMAFSIEARVPFLNHELVEFVMNIPLSQRTTFNDPKYLLKEIVKDLLPGELLNAPKKGFVLPLNNWLKTSLRSEVEYYLGSDYLKNQGILNPKLYNQLVKPHLMGSTDNTEKIWTLLMFQFWFEEFMMNQG